MTSTYELWDRASGNLLETYATRDEALDDIHAAIAEHGPGIVSTLLLSEDKDGRPRRISIRREETAGEIESLDGRSRRGRIDYILRIKVTPDSYPIAVALIEAKAEDLPARSRARAACRNVERAAQ
ncbi:MAG TPA: hypothetical protein VGR16_05875 [Thermomicrobiales bacterium]|nr:hypothetical protein [Thermomicrobiales bacterium]